MTPSPNEIVGKKVARNGATKSDNKLVASCRFRPSKVVAFCRSKLSLLVAYVAQFHLTLTFIYSLHDFPPPCYAGR